MARGTRPAPVPGAPLPGGRLKGPSRRGYYLFPDRRSFRAVHEAREPPPWSGPSSSLGAPRPSPCAGTGRGGYSSPTSTPARRSSPSREPGELRGRSTTRGPGRWSPGPSTSSSTTRSPHGLRSGGLQGRGGVPRPQGGRLPPPGLQVGGEVRLASRHSLEPPLVGSIAKELWSEELQSAVQGLLRRPPHLLFGP